MSETAESTRLALTLDTHIDFAFCPCLILDCKFFSNLTYIEKAAIYNWFITINTSCEHFIKFIKFHDGKSDMAICFEVVFATLCFLVNQQKNTLYAWLPNNFF